MSVWSLLFGHYCARGGGGGGSVANDTSHVVYVTDMGFGSIRHNTPD